MHQYLWRRWMLVAAWGLNKGRGDLTVRERGRGDLSKEEEAIGAAVEREERGCGFGMREG